MNFAYMMRALLARRLKTTRDNDTCREAHDHASLYIGLHRLKGIDFEHLDHFLSTIAARLQESDYHTTLCDSSAEAGI